MKLLLIIPIVFVLIEWIYIILPERFQCRKCWSFWLSIPLLLVPHGILEAAVTPATVSLLYYILDKKTTLFEKKFKL